MRVVANCNHKQCATVNFAMRPPFMPTKQPIIEQNRIFSILRAFSAVAYKLRMLRPSTVFQPQTWAYEPGLLRTLGKWTVSCIVLARI
jgi:hypothetical protein